MAEQFIIDMSRARRRKKRSRANIRKYWNTRFTAFVNAGFTEEEAIWGANIGMPLRDKKTIEILRHRRALVELYMGRHFQYTRKEAIEAASKDLRKKLDDAGEDELILYYEVSP